jgi:hypothetical protein
MILVMEKVKELKRGEFDSTFSRKMIDITSGFDTRLDIWGYVKSLNKSQYFLNEYIIEKVYRNSESTYDQILIPTLKKNVFLIIVISLNNKSIFGHYLLDLNKE